MAMSLLSGIKEILGFEGVGNTALGIIEKIAGTDWTPQQRADFILSYHAVTKHLSVARRFIAISLTIGFALYGFAWLCSTISYHLYLFFNVGGETLAEIVASENLAKIKAKPLLQLSNDLMIYMKDVLSEPFTWILSFYFVVDLAGKIKK